MASKRTATTNLNHDNWDREEEPEEFGSFKVASEEVLKQRVIKSAKRRNPTQNVEGEKPNIFGSFTGFAKPQPAAQMFSFLSNLQETTEPSKTNGVKRTKTTLDKVEKPVVMSTANSFSNSNSSSSKVEDQPDHYYARLKGLNESVSKWIKQHVDENPLINLQPIFKDYEQFFNDLEKEKNQPGNVNVKKDNFDTFKFKSGDQVAVSNSDKSKSIFSFPEKATSSVSSAVSQSSPMFSFGGPSTTSTTTTSASISGASNVTSGAPKFSFGNPSATQFTFSSGSTTPFTFGNVQKLPTEELKPDDEEEELPKEEVKEVEEKDYIYTIRCKVFVKKEGNFVEKGVGNLYLKQVPNKEKYQLIVRALTNLGNLLCNFILSEGIPIKKMGKNNVMLVCIPTPDSKPPPVPVLLRVKSSENADDLLKTLESYVK